MLQYTSRDLQRNLRVGVGGLRVQSSGCRVQGAGCRVQGVGCGVGQEAAGLDEFDGVLGNLAVSRDYLFDKPGSDLGFRVWCLGVRFQNDGLALTPRFSSGCGSRVRSSEIRAWALWFGVWRLWGLRLRV